MCGIAGVVGAGARDHVDRVHTMIEALDHRGPDEHGIVVHDSAVLGSARLAIIDPADGHQPLIGPGGGTALVCNGEIYGYRQLKSQYSSYPFRTGSDCEVVLAVHERHGEDVLSHLPGTFALALWDERNGTLIAARDRFGERPLYYTVTPEGTLVFASESRALLASGLVDPSPDPEVIAHFLRQGYVPPRRSVWEGVHSLGPGSSLRWDRSRGPSVERWWNPPQMGWRPTKAEATDWFRSELERAVLEQLQSDVPIGAFLSGGIDSTTVAALAGRSMPNLPVFTYDMPGESEVPSARESAQRHGLDLHVLTPDLRDLADQLVALAGVWDEPFGDSSALPTRQLCEFARERVKVVLTGDGADELLGGYLGWARECLGDEVDPTEAPAAGGTAVAGWWRRRRRREGADRSSAVGVGSALARRYAGFRQAFTGSELASMGLPGIGASDIDTSRYREGTVDDMSRFDLDHYLPGDVLVKTDRASMAYGLEVRAPYLDVALAEGCLSLPAHHKADDLQEKLLLRRAFGDLWPESVVSKAKQGFGAPMGAWLRRDDVHELTRYHLSDDRSPLFELVDRDAVRPYLETEDQRTWNLLMLSLWLSHHRSREPAHGT